MAAFLNLSVVVAARRTPTLPTATALIIIVIIKHAFHHPSYNCKIIFEKKQLHINNIKPR
jgi:hypothetical protein